MGAYWRDKRSEKRYRVARQRGSGGVMVWTAIFAGKSELVFIDGGVDSTTYIKVLNEHLLEWLDVIVPTGCCFSAI